MSGFIALNACVRLSTQRTLRSSPRSLPRLDMPLHNTTRLARIWARKHGSASHIPRRSLRSSSASIISYMALIGSAFVFSAIYNPDLRYLESPPEIVEGLVAGYKPPFEPLTLEQAEEILTWDQDSEAPQAGSTVLRLDQVRIPSNVQMEDHTTVGHGIEDDGELVWLVTGVFDGHA